MSLPPLQQCWLIVFPVHSFVHYCGQILLQYLINGLSNPSETYRE